MFQPENEGLEALNIDFNEITICFERNDIEKLKEMIKEIHEKEKAL